MWLYTPSGLECKKQNKKIVGLKCKQKYTKIILLNVTIPILTSFTLSNLFHILMFNAFQRFFISGVQKSYFQDKGITGKMVFFTMTQSTFLICVIFFFVSYIQDRREFKLWHYFYFSHHRIIFFLNI